MRGYNKKLLIPTAFLFKQYTQPCYLGTARVKAPTLWPDDQLKPSQSLSPEIKVSMHDFRFDVIVVRPLLPQIFHLSMKNYRTLI